MLVIVLGVALTVVVLIARSKLVRDYFEASSNVSSSSPRSSKRSLTAAERRRVAAEIVAATDAGGSHWVEGVAVAESHGVSVFDVHDEVMAILDARDEADEAAAFQVTRELLGAGPEPRDFGDGGARVSVRGVSHWIERHELAELESDFFVLVREPSNRHDRNAIAVFGGDRKVGYVSAKRAEVYAPLLDAAGVTRVRVARAEGDGLCVRLPSLSVVRRFAQSE